MGKTTTLRNAPVGSTVIVTATGRRYVKTARVSNLHNLGLVSPTNVDWYPPDERVRIESHPDDAADKEAVTALESRLDQLQAEVLSMARYIALPGPGAEPACLTGTAHAPSVEPVGASAANGYHYPAQR